MRILWLYQYFAWYDFDFWLHLHFAEVIRTFPGIEILVYGPGIDVGYPHLTTLPYDPKITIEDIHKHFPFDAIIINTKSRMFSMYNPHAEIEVGEWVPSGTDAFQCPRIVIEEDYHYEKDDRWYQRHGVDIILQRHYSQSLRQTVVPMKWFPFSVDINMFKPIPSQKRLNRICLVGSTSPNTGVYGIRNKASEILRENHILDAFTKHEKIGNNYIRCLQSYTSHLSCASTYKLTPAKMFEIMACGSVLLTNRNDDLEQLFPPGSYREYRSDCSDVVNIAKDILSDVGKTERMVQLGITAINERHSHYIRISQLVEIIEDLKKGNK